MKRHLNAAAPAAEVLIIAILVGRDCHGDYRHNINLTVFALILIIKNVNTFQFCYH